MPSSIAVSCHPREKSRPEKLIPGSRGRRASRRCGARLGNGRVWHKHGVLNQMESSRMRHGHRLTVVDVPRRMLSRLPSSTRLISCLLPMSQSTNKSRLEAERQPSAVRCGTRNCRATPYFARVHLSTKSSSNGRKRYALGVTIYCPVFTSN